MASCPQDTCAIIAAGGLGLRFGDERGKQYVEACGRRVIDWTIDAFLQAPSIAHVVVVCPKGRCAETQGRRAASPRITYVEGGATRQDSCLAGIRHAPEALRYVAIHDGARPLIEPADIERVIAQVRSTPGLDGAICARPMTDTLKVVRYGLVESTPDRTLFWGAQTPQVFRREVVLAAHEQARSEGFVGTDDASLVERAGGHVACVEGAATNIKMTTPEDLAVIEAELRRRGVVNITETPREAPCFA